jgi:hypothetical protein
MEDLKFLRPLSVGNKMRTGPANEGGYVVYKPSLYNTNMLISYGVGWDIRFEVDYYNLTNNKIHMFDPTMFDKDFINWSHCKRLLYQFRIRQLCNYMSFSYGWKKKIAYLKKHDIWFHNEGIAAETKVKHDTFARHLIKLNITAERILLKIDIEGNEYAVLNDSDFHKSLCNVELLIIEFHDLKNKLRSLEFIIQKLKEQFELVHIHGNNCGKSFTLYRDMSDLVFPDVIEMTFVRKESLSKEDILDSEMDYPCCGLDSPNSFLAPDFERLTFE